MLGYILKQSINKGRSVAQWRSLTTTSTLQSIVKVNEKSGVRTVTLANPKTRNALSLEMLEELHSAIFKDDSNLRCIILTAEGKVFSAGHNLKEMTSTTGREYHYRIFDSCTRLMEGIASLPVPVMAKVDGVAAAAGCQLVASCDIVIASEESSFSTPGANVGIFCSTPGIPLARNVPRKVSAHMLLTGLPITAEEALRAGLVSKVVPASQLEDETQKAVDAILHKSSSVISLGKRFLQRQLEMNQSGAYSLGGEVMVNNINMKDGQEGIKSFIEKRKPVWSHSDD